MQNLVVCVSAIQQQHSLVLLVLEIAWLAFNTVYMSVAAGTVNKTQQEFLSHTECADHLANHRCFPDCYNVTLILQNCTQYKYT